MFSSFSSSSKCFKSKVIIITGSSCGIGASVAVRFATDGASAITLNGRNREALEEVKRRCEMAADGQAKIHICMGDITDEHVRHDLIDSTLNRFGRLDILINNAGIGQMASIHEASMDDFDRIFDVNVRSLIALTKLALPHLIESKGNVVNVSSVASTRASAAAPFYSCSKAAVDQFTKCLALDLGPKGVRVNSVNPGYINAPDTRDARNGTNKEAKEAVAKLAPLRRAGTVEEIAKAVAYLASDKASFITGHNLIVDGGLGRI